MSRIEGVAKLAELAKRIGAVAEVDDHPAWREYRREVKEIVTEGNERLLLTGRDSHGNQMPALKESTLKRRKYGGPPTVPRLKASGPIRAFVAKWGKRSGDWTLSWSWPSFPAASYLIYGTRHMVPRDFSQIAPSTMKRIEEANGRLERGLSEGL